MARAIRLLLAAGLALSASGAAAAEDPAASHRRLEFIAPPATFLLLGRLSLLRFSVATD